MGEHLEGGFESGLASELESGLGSELEDAEIPDAELTDRELQSVLESLLLVVDSPAPVRQLADATATAEDRIDAMLRRMSADLTESGSGIDLRYAGDGWRFYTRTEHAPYVERLLLDGARSKLTRAALETLAVIAYRQPVTRARVSAVRGVNVDGVVRTLLARGLIAEAAADPETNATQYVTTELFLERLGLASLAELPELAPLLPDVDVIDDLHDSLDTDPRMLRRQGRYRSDTLEKNPGADPGPGIDTED
ncbi:SMC-Scp complex subunit ScpB [Rhodococcus sp. HNM0569]|nr:SMC-Scp complex subunit ScpB [Rhodococcus sp. HNM0569]